MKIQLDKDNKANAFDKSNLNSNPEIKGSDELNKMLRSGIKAAQAGKRAEARNLLLNVTEAEPNNEDAWLWLASISEYPEELLIFLNNVLKINPENEKALEWAKSTKALLAKTFVERGIKASEDNQKDFAKQCFLQAIVHDDQNELAWLWLASISNAAEEKNSYLQRVLRINPENESALASLQKLKSKRAKSLLEKANEDAAGGDIEKALNSLRESLKQAPELEEAWILKSHLTSSLSEKLECFEKVLELNPENPIAQAGVASLKGIVGNSKPAKAEDNPVENIQKEADSQPVEKPEATQSIPKPSHNLLDESSDDLLDLKPVDEQNEVESKSIAKPDSAFFEETKEKNPYETVVFRQKDEKPIAEQETEAFEYSEEEIPEPEEIVEPEVQEISAEEEEQPEPEEVSAESPESPESVEADDLDNLEEEFIEEAHALVDDLAENAVAKTNGASADTNGKEKIKECPFCHAENEQQEFVCNSCNAMLTFSDIEMLISHSGQANVNLLEEAVLQLEAEKKYRPLSAKELTNLGLAEINLRNYRKGFEHFQEAVQADPNDVILHSQVNSLAIRISEIEEKASHEEAMPKNKTILVVDDSATVRKLISSKLEKCGHEVICAVDGKDALEKINEIVPDLILLDITMPRMDGYQVCKLIRGNDVTKEVPVVMISGKDGFFDKVRGRMAGTSGYITKPFGPETLMKTVEAYL